MLLDYIRDQMEAKNITQEMVAERTGFTQSNISRMLSAKYPPTLDNLLMLCEAASCFIFIIDKDSNEDTATLMRERWGKTSKN